MFSFLWLLFWTGHSLLFALWARPMAFTFVSFTSYESNIICSFSFGVSCPQFPFSSFGFHGGLAGPIIQRKMIIELKDAKMMTETAVCYCRLVTCNLLLLGPTKRTREK